MIASYQLVCFSKNISNSTKELIDSKFLVCYLPKFAKNENNAWPNRTGNLVPRVLHERETLENAGHVSPKFRLGDYKRQHGGRGCQVRSLSVPILLRHEDYMLRKNISGLCHEVKMSNIETAKRVYAPAGHLNLSCCRLCKSVGDNISHSKNLFAKNTCNRALLACVEELFGGSLSQNELLHVATFGM